MEYSYWEIQFISCESNERWTIARAPLDWDETQVEERIPIGGCGDDVAKIISVEPANSEDYGWDFTD